MALRSNDNEDDPGRTCQGGDDRNLQTHSARSMAVAVAGFKRVTLFLPALGPKSLGDHCP